MPWAWRLRDAVDPRVVVGAFGCECRVITAVGHTSIGHGHSLVLLDEITLPDITLGEKRLLL